MNQRLKGRPANKYLYCDNNQKRYERFNRDNQSFPTPKPKCITKCSTSKYSEAHQTDPAGNEHDSQDSSTSFVSRRNGFLLSSWWSGVVLTLCGVACTVSTRCWCDWGSGAELNQVRDENIGGTYLFFHANPSVVCGLVPPYSTCVVVVACARQCSSLGRSLQLW